MSEPVKTALIVDDNADLCAMLKALLESEGYEVASASNGSEAIEIQRQSPARLVITDVFMPEVDGLELIGTIKKEFPNSKIVVISGNQNVSYLKTASMIGANAVLIKPFRPTEFLETLKTLERE